jgi:5-methylthioadenosine/S-adenosylhomocysteine deaminase
MDEKARVIEDGAILIERGRIASVGESEIVKKGINVDRIIDVKGKIVLPGLINAHDHADQTLYRTMAYDLNFAVWDMRYMFKTGKFAEEEDYYYAGLVTFAELLKSGTTTTVPSHSYHKSWRNFDSIAKSAEDIGIRACLGFGIADKAHYPFTAIDAKRSLREFERAYRDWNGKANGRINVWVSPTGFGSTSDEGLTGSVDMAKKHKTRLTIHVAGTWASANNPYWATLKGETEHLRDLEILGPNTLASHCVWLTEDDLQIFNETGTSVAHNPISNAYLAFGIAPVHRMIRMGIPTALGTDGLGSNTHDMFEVMRTAAYLQKVNTSYSGSITSQEILEMATIGGARALGLEKEIGSIEEGKRADLIVVNTKKLHMTPYKNPVPAIVYCAKASDVETVIVDGKAVVEDSALETMDESRLIDDARKKIGEFWKRSDSK